MRRFLFQLILLTGLFSCNPAKEIYLSTSFHEPADEGLRYIYSHDGINWDSVPGVWLKPEVGEQKVLRDPSVVQGPDGIYHLVWTSSWKNDDGFGYASSRDLIHWSGQKHIPVMAHDTSTVNVWAPEIFYDDVKSEYIIIWASTVPYKFQKGVEDEYNNHRLYYVSTKDFITFTPAKIFFDPGYSVIDAVVVKRAEGDYVNVFKDNTRPNRNLRVAFGKTPLGPWTGISTPFTQSLTEGPTVIKKGDEYIIYYDAYRNMNYGASSTKDFIHFKDLTDSVSVPAGHKHGTMIKVPLKLVQDLLIKKQ